MISGDTDDIHRGCRAPMRHGSPATAQAQGRTNSRGSSHTAVWCVDTAIAVGERTQYSQRRKDKSMIQGTGLRAQPTSAVSWHSMLSRLPHFSWSAAGLEEQCAAVRYVEKTTQDGIECRGAPSVIRTAHDPVLRTQGVSQPHESPCDTSGNASFLRGGVARHGGDHRP
jgi:hypothetical protein